MMVLGAVITGLALRKPSEEGRLGAGAVARAAAGAGAPCFFGLTLRGLGLAPG